MKTFLLLAAASLACACTSGAEFTGLWQIQSSVGTTPVTISCNLIQTGNSLAGSCQPQVEGIGATELTGAVDGSNAEWGYDVVFNGNPGRVDYRAVLSADGTMQGTMSLSGTPTAFTALKQ
jgi:hypothetical protein